MLLTTTPFVLTFNIAQQVKKVESPEFSFDEENEQEVKFAVPV
jgi:hypothetical protein